MNKKVIFCVGTIVGFVVGFVATNHYLKKEYKRISDEEIESVKHAVGFYENINLDKEKVKPELSNQTQSTPINDISIMEKEHAKYIKAIEENHYGEHFKPENPHSGRYPYGSPESIQYVGPDEIGDDDAYQMIHYVYWNDDILTEGAIRSVADIIDDPAIHVGFDFIDHAGEYEEGTVYGVNHTLKEYFEIDFVDEPFNEEDDS